MIKLSSIKYYICHPIYFLLNKASEGKFPMSDKTFLELRYKQQMGKELDLKKPQTFNEKLQWLKLYNRKPEYTTMVDKYAVKKYVADKIGEEYIIPTLGVWDNFDDIDFDKLPNQFVLKCTHDSGGLVICKDKAKLDIKAAREKINKSLKRNYYYAGREWPYKNVPPRIIAEKYMVDKGNEVLPVFKFLCFGGEPMIIQTIQNDKTINESVDYFDIYWNKLDLKQNFPNSTFKINKPNSLNEMIDLARILTLDTPFLRADFYEINGKVYFSELTFFSDGGNAIFYPKEWDYKLGSYIKLPQKTINNKHFL